MVIFVIPGLKGGKTDKEKSAELSDGRLVLDQIVPGETIQAPVYVILRKIFAVNRKNLS